jgi:signal peptidase II
LEALLKQLFKTYLPVIGIVGLIVTLDQLTKYLVRSNLGMSETWSPFLWLAPYARIVHWYNTGVAFGFFQNSNLLFAILASIVVLAIIYYYPHVPAHDWTLRLAMCLQLGGALGNLIDRVTIGHVTDFISVGNFAVFNVADSSITVGVCVLIYGFWLQEKNAKRREGSAETNSSAGEETSKNEIQEK